MSPRPGFVIVLRHAVGLAFAIVLIPACLFAMLVVTSRLGGTLVEDLGALTAFAAGIAVLGAGDWLWTRLKPLGAGGGSAAE